MARDKLRFRLQVELLPYASALSRRLLDALRGEGEGRSTTQGRYQNWAHVTGRTIAAAVARGAVLEQPEGCWDIARVAHVFGRSLSYLSLQDRVRRACFQFASPEPQLVPLPPNCNGSMQHFGSLALGLYKQVGTLGLRHGCTPLSAKGASCSGWLLAISRSGPYPAYVPFLMGNEALHRWPFTPGNRDASGFARDAVEDMEGGPEDAPPRFSEDYGERFRRRPCPLCQAPDLSMFHLMCECRHPAVATARQRAVLSLGQLYQSVTQHCYAALEAEGHDLEGVPDVSEALVALPGAVSRVPLSTEGKFLLYWTIAACPWTGAAIPQDQPVAQSLGTLFDAVLVRHQLLRPLADLWLRWSDCTIRDFAAGWAAENAEDATRVQERIGTMVTGTSCQP